MKDGFTKIGGTKIGFAVTLCALAFILTLTAAPRAAGQSLTTDLSMRRALYFTGPTEIFHL